MSTWMRPTRTARTKTACRRVSASSLVPRPATALKTTSEMAFVGPLIRWDDEPNSAASTVGTMAVYRPYCGGRPAISAYAMAWGTATAATVRPAARSRASRAREYDPSDQVGLILFSIRRYRGCG